MVETLPGHDGRVATAYQLEFVSDFWVNLHHVLYAAAWDGPRRAALNCTEWLAAIDYYDRNIADRHLLFDEGMQSGFPWPKGDSGIGAGLRRALAD
jgi:hypothetical protein